MRQDQKFIVKETPLIRQQIKKYKKWYERYILFPYAIYMNDNYYYYVQYITFKNFTGILLIKSNGEVPSYEEVKLPCLHIDRYNACIGGAGTDLIEAKELSTWLFEMKLKLFNLLKEEKSISLSEIQHEIDRICYVCEQYLYRQERLKQIYSEIEAIYKRVNLEQYLTLDEAKKVNDLFIEYKRVIYRAGRLKLETSADAKKIIKFIESNKDKISAKNKKEIHNLSQLLRSYNKTKTLEKSLVQFELDPNGNRLNFAKGDLGVQQMVENESLIHEKIIRDKVYPFIRNESSQKN